MKLNSLTDQSMNLLRKVLDLRAENEKVIASNIANSETPGYAPSKFNFENDLKKALESGNFTMKTTHGSHIPLSPTNLNDVNGRIIASKDRSSIGDKNGVNLDQEMLALSQNEILYETAAQLLKKKLGMQKYIISGGQ